MSGFDSSWVAEFRLQVGCRMEPNEPMSRHTTFGVGGPAQLLVLIESEADLLKVWQHAARRSIKRRVIGKGSNVLVSDRGLAGVTAKLAGKLTSIKKLDSSKSWLDIEVGGGCALGRLLGWAEKHGAGGLAGLVGIPATVGGAIKLNAGTMVGCVGDHLLEVRMLRGKSLVWIQAAKLGLGYRCSAIGPLSVIVSARFRLPVASKAEVVKAYASARRARANQPKGVRSAGCFFKNPKEMSAGALIEASGCKGIRSGDAMVSTIHANYLLNMGRAKAADILRLAHRVMRCVRTYSGVRLEREVELWGWVRGGCS